MPARTPRKKSAGGRPRLTESGARERLISTANALFYQRGIRNVGIDEVIAEANVAKASLYNHFASKDELIVECLRVRDADWRVWLATEVNRRATTPRERLLAVFDALGAWITDAEFRGCAFQNAVVEVADTRHPAHKAAAKQKHATRAYLGELAREAKARQPDMLADQLSMLMEGAIMSALLHGASPAVETARATAAQLVRAAFR